MTMRSFYIRIAGEEQGPVGAAELRQLVRSGVLTRSDHVRESESTQWLPATKIRGAWPEDQTFSPASPPVPSPAADRAEVDHAFDPSTPAPQPLAEKGEGSNGAKREASSTRDLPHQTTKGAEILGVSATAVTCLQIVGTVLLWIWTLAVGAVFVVLIYACVVNTEKLSAGAFWGLFVLFGVFARSLAAACSATYSVHERLSGRVARADGLTEKSDL
jgi:hypothetical protein